LRKHAQAYSAGARNGCGRNQTQSGWHTILAAVNVKPLTLITEHGLACAIDRDEILGEDIHQRFNAGGGRLEFGNWAGKPVGIYRQVVVGTARQQTDEQPDADQTLI
jgi:hypothetical protein